MVKQDPAFLVSDNSRKLVGGCLRGMFGAVKFAAADEFVCSHDDHKGGNHAEQRMGQKMLAAEHLVNAGGPTEQQAQAEAEPTVARGFEKIEQRHQGKTGRGVSGRKTASRFELDKIVGISFQNADERILAVVDSELIRAIDVCDIFGAGDDCRNKNNA